MDVGQDLQWLIFCHRIVIHVDRKETQAYKDLWKQRGSPSEIATDLRSRLNKATATYAENPQPLHQLLLILWSALEEDPVMLASFMYDSGIRRTSRALDTVVSSLEAANPSNSQTFLDPIRSLVFVIRQLTGLNVLAARYVLKAGILRLLARAVAAWPRQFPIFDNLISCIDLMLDHFKMNLVNFTVLCAAQEDIYTWNATFLASAFARVPRLRETWKILHNCFEYRRRAFPSDPRLLQKMRQKICCNGNCKLVAGSDIDRVDFALAFLHLNRKFKECSKCNRVQYCSVECQTKDWPMHKGPCKAFAKMNKDKTMPSILYEDDRDRQLSQGIALSDLCTKIHDFRRIQADFLRENTNIPLHQSVIEIDYTVECDPDPFKLRMRSIQQVREEDGMSPSDAAVADCWALMKYQYGLQCRDIMFPLKLDEMLA